MNEFKEILIIIINVLYGIGLRKLELLQSSYFNDQKNFNLSKWDPKLIIIKYRMRKKKD
jgi:hypothetical protein